MKTVLFISVLSLALAATLHATPRISANYEIASDAVDGGGGHTASAAYSNTGSSGGFAGTGASGGPVQTTMGGFVGQLHEIVGYAVAAGADDIYAGGTLALEAWLALDDGTLLPIVESLGYQWYFDGVELAGATSREFARASVQSFHSGQYSVRIIHGNGSTVLAPSLALTISAPPPSPSRLLNLSTRAQALTGDDVLIPGFVVAGTGNKRLLIRAVGPTLGKHPFNLGGVLADPSMRLLKRNPVSTLFEEIAANDNWGTNTNAAAIAQTAADFFAFDFNDTLEAALLLDATPGEYTVIAGGVNNATGLAIVELYDADPSTGSGQAAASRLINISNRGFCGVGDNVMIPGFVVSSEGPKTLLVRVVGPTLAGAPFSVPGTMTDPKLEVFPGGALTPILTNDNWGDNPDAAHTAQVAAQVGAFALTAGSKDAAFVVTLPPGSYTVVGSSAAAGGTGVVLVEVYVVQ